MGCLLDTTIPSYVNITDEPLGFGLAAGIWLQDGSDWSTFGVKMGGIGSVGECQGYKTSGCVMGNESIGLDDLKELDPELYKNLKYILEYKEDNLEEVLYCNFIVEYECFFEKFKYELK